MPEDPHFVVYTVKELLQQVNERLAAVDQKLDLRLAQIDDRVTHVERTQSERQYLIAEHKEMLSDVEALKTFRSRFLPMSIVAGLLAALALITDIYLRTT